jgi:Flp pilus assembly protein TadD
MPNLARIVDNGVMGNLATLTPLSSALLWTSVATGQSADRHGILDSVEPDFRTGGVRPATKASLNVPQVWDILADEGFRCRVIGWPVTHPAGPPAVCVSDGFTSGAPESIFPKDLESKLLPLRFHPTEWTGDDLRLFVPDLALIDQENDQRLARLAVILAETVTIQAAATALMETGAADFSAVWFGAVGWVCNLFPPGTEDVYKDVLSGVYRFLDLLLGRLVELAGPDAHVMVVSDRSAFDAVSRASSGVGPSGLLCASGPGFDADELAFGAGLLDIAPTVLGLFDFAPAPGMTGHAVPEICTNVPSRFVREMAVAKPYATDSPPHFELDLTALEVLGYKDSVGAARKPEAEAARTRRDLNLAWVLLAQGRIAEAVPLFERLANAHPERTDIRLYLAHTYYRTDRLPECRAVCETFLAGFPDSPLVPLARAHIAISEKDIAGARTHLANGGEFPAIAAALDIAIGEAFLRTKNWEEAAEVFLTAIQADEAQAAAHEGLARALLLGERYTEAAEAAMDAVRLHYDFSAAHRTLGAALRALGREDAAVNAFATAEKLRGPVLVS